MSNSQIIDRLWQIHNARKAIAGLLQACEQAADAGMFVQLHHIGGLLKLLEDEEEKVFDQLQNQSKQAA
ncbi:MAG: hypothetical protein COW76_20445 [Shewanella sp. CG18_big_fil_WC_8_21_14_2_50_42_11]|uniref:hypothetical protein n=1 Tax=Shewanella sp. CG18_big_fil_WC_8_21_14_2_50_42_11 TaxID=1975538 RepID=UPI000C6BA0AB|nr:hypothetical protein [Shewanella sp. CG18_big_fil_WC_8_21_14_2_50_42_11]PIP98534.1 MAG: hypothetical protein COW76_20445 [Shewanella sp. CG18_big_fil_WC_8_21_14_2_50_42_11]